MANSRPWVPGVLALSAALAVSPGRAQPQGEAVRAVVLGLRWVPGALADPAPRGHAVARDGEEFTL